MPDHQLSSRFTVTAEGWAPTAGSPTTIPLLFSPGVLATRGPQGGNIFQVLVLGCMHIQQRASYVLQRKRHAEKQPLMPSAQEPSPKSEFTICPGTTRVRTRRSRRLRSLPAPCGSAPRCTLSQMDHKALLRMRPREQGDSGREPCKMAAAEGQAPGPGPVGATAGKRRILNGDWVAEPRRLSCL